MLGKKSTCKAYKSGRQVDSELDILKWYEATGRGIALPTRFTVSERVVAACKYLMADRIKYLSRIMIFYAA
jgi:hypothetical protein